MFKDQFWASLNMHHQRKENEKVSTLFCGQVDHLKLFSNVAGRIRKI
jgi:hypothetical protein